MYSSGVFCVIGITDCWKLPKSGETHWPTLLPGYIIERISAVAPQELFLALMSWLYWKRFCLPSSPCIPCDVPFRLYLCFFYCLSLLWTSAQYDGDCDIHRRHLHDSRLNLDVYERFINKFSQAILSVTYLVCGA